MSHGHDANVSLVQTPLPLSGRAFAAKSIPAPAARYAYGINSVCEKLERFLRTDDRIETVRFEVLDTPGVALKKLKGFRREGDKFVKKVRAGKKLFDASVQAPSQGSAV